MFRDIRFRIAAFLLLTYGLSSIFYVRIASSGQLKMLPTFGLMWCPAVAAVVVRLATQGNLRGTGWIPRPMRWLSIGYLVPAALGLIVYGLVWLTGLGGFDADGLNPGAHKPLLPAVLLIATAGMIISTMSALGEEIGWRGFLVPELARISSFTTTGATSGAAWAVYHYPLILFANYTSGTPAWFALPVFTGMVVASAFVYAWVRLKSGSVWPSVILHASHNLFIQNIFDRLTIDRGHTKYLTTEFGAGLALAYTIVAVYLWRRRAELPAASVPASRIAARPADRPSSRGGREGTPPAS